MNKVIRSIRIQTIILLLIQVIVMIGISSIYAYDLFGLRNVFEIDTVLLIVASLTLIDAFFVWFSLSRIFRVRQRTDLTAAEIIGSDVKEAYNFGMIGLVVVDNNFNVIWMSDLFAARQINILDTNILEWQKPLTTLISTQNRSSIQHDDDDELTVKIEVNNRNYEVKYLSDAALFIFKDITDFEYLLNENRKQSIVVGIVMIDNFTDVNANREVSNPTTSLITSSIFEYCRDFGVLVRKYRDDAFLLVCNHQSFERMRTDRFSVLDKVRSIEFREANFTLSMGFAYNFPDINKLNDMALSAVDLALARGGDQVVISKYGSEQQYFGGVNVASEKRNKVKVRVTADNLTNVIRNATNVIIMGHVDTDMDALGSALGIKVIADYIKRKDSPDDKKFIPAYIVYDQKSVEKKTKMATTLSFSKEEMNQIFVTSHDLLTDKSDRSLIRPNTLLIVTDVSRPTYTMVPALLDKVSNVAVIDHHRRAEDFLSNPVFTYIEPGASSTSELVAELARYGNFPDITISPKFATLMLAGIYLDTNYFRSNTTGMRTFEACMFLKDFGADNGQADDFLKDEYEEYSLITKIMSTSKTPYYGVVVAKADTKDIIDRATLAKVANQGINLKGVSACFVIGMVEEKEVRISARSDGSVNVQLLLEKIGGGGHQASAAASFPNATIEKVEAQLLATLEQYLSEARPERKK